MNDDAAHSMHGRAPEQPETGRFANPTGFVGDRVTAADASANSAAAAGSNGSASPADLTSSSSTAPNSAGRIRREEQVYSGKRLAAQRDIPTPASTPRFEHHSRAYARERASRHPDSLIPHLTRAGRRERRRRRRSVFRFVLGCSAAGAGIAYLIGVLAEFSQSLPKGSEELRTEESKREFEKAKRNLEDAKRELEDAIRRDLEEHLRSRFKPA